MKRVRVLAFFAVLMICLSFISADTFMIASGQGGISIGGITGNQIGGITGVPVVTTPATTVSGPSGGGGIVLPNPVQNLAVSPSSFNLPASAGIESSGKIVLSNKGSTALNLTISFSGTTGLIQFNSSKLTLRATQTMILDFSINPPDKAGIYTGQIIFSSGNEQTIVPVVVNAGEGQSLFDISVNIPEQQKFVQQGGNLSVQVSLAQKGILRETDVTLDYTIKDFNGNIYRQSTETVAVYNQQILERAFDVSNLSSGNYLLGVEAIYSGGIATASAQFTVVSPGQAISKSPGLSIFSLATGTFVLMGAVLSFFIVFTIILIIKIRRERRIWKV